MRQQTPAEPPSPTLSYDLSRPTLRLRVSWRSRQLYLNTGLVVEATDIRGKAKWDGRRCRPNTFHGPESVPATAINRELAKLEARVRRAFDLFAETGETPTREQLVSVIGGEEPPAQTIEQATIRFMREGELRRGWSANTVKSVRNALKAFLSYKDGMTFADVTPELMEAFTAHMGSHRLSTHAFKTGQQGYSNSTALKIQRVLKWFFSWAARKGLMERGQWETDDLPPKRIKQPVVFLDWDELMRLESLRLQPESEEERALDFFLFCCFTGLRYSDAASLLKGQVGQDGFDIVTRKTGDPLRIELNSHSRRILDRYADSDDDHALPRITLNRLNHLLKDIGEVAGLDSPVLKSQYYGARRIDRTLPKHRLLSSHCARRTFICNALALGIPPHVVMRWTGHSDWSAMRPYIEAGDRLKAEKMRLFDKGPKRQ